MGGWERLTRYGDFDPARAPSSGGEVPASVGELIALHGVGKLLGLFDVAAPGGEVWSAWQARARLLRSRGFFMGISSGELERLSVFATTATGHALAVAPTKEGESFYLLGSAGSVVGLGRAVDGFLAELLERARLIFPNLETVWDSSKEKHVPKYDWGIDLSFVTRSFDGQDRYMRALAGAEDDVALLEGALVGEPHVLALHRLLARLVGAEGDRLEPDVRAEAVGPLVTMARRRYLGVEGVPQELFERQPWTREAVRAWASGDELIAMRKGPFAEDPAVLERLPEIGDVPDDARAPLAAPRMDYDAVFDTWLASFDKRAELPPLRRVRELAASVPASLRFAVVRRLAWDNWPVRGGHDYPLADADRRFVAAADPYPLRSLAGAHLATAWPILLVYLVHVTRFEYETSRVGLDALRSVRAPEATLALVALTELGFEWPVACGQLVNGESIDDATLARLLPTVKTKGVRALVVVLVMGRIDRDEVYDLALESVKKL